MRRAKKAHSTLFLGVQFGSLSTLSVLLLLLLLLLFVYRCPCLAHTFKPHLAQRDAAGMSFAMPPTPTYVCLNDRAAALSRVVAPVLPRCIDARAAAEHLEVLQCLPVEAGASALITSRLFLSHHSIIRRLH